jgi:hypothetical protein
LAVAPDRLGHHVSHTVIAELLHALGYSSKATPRPARADSILIGTRYFATFARRQLDLPTGKIVDAAQHCPGRWPVATTKAADDLGRHEL